MLLYSKLHLMGCNKISSTSNMFINISRCFLLSRAMCSLLRTVLKGKGCCCFQWCSAWGERLGCLCCGLVAACGVLGWAAGDGLLGMGWWHISLGLHTALCWGAACIDAPDRERAKGSQPMSSTAGLWGCTELVRWGGRLRNSIL